MAPLLAVILGKLLDYVAEHADDIVEAIKKQFEIKDSDTSMLNALKELGYAPTEENLNKVHDLLVASGKDGSKLADVLINETTVPEV